MPGWRESCNGWPCIITAPLLKLIHDAAEAVLILSEGLARDELLRSRLTRAEVLRQLRCVADTLGDAPDALRHRLAELDWAGWRATRLVLPEAGVAQDEALWFAVQSLVPATLSWLRAYRQGSARCAIFRALDPAALRVQRSLFETVMETGASIALLTQEMQDEQELFASALTLRAVEAQLLNIAHTLGNVTPALHQALLQVDWLGWAVLHDKLRRDVQPRREETWCAVNALVPQTMELLRALRRRQPVWFEVGD